MKTQRFTDQQTNEKLKEGLDSIDNERSKRLEHSRKIMQLSRQSLSKEELRLQSKYGSSSPRVKKLQRRIAYKEQVELGLEKEEGRSRVRVPVSDPKSWLVLGRVSGPDGKPQNGLTLSLFNQENQWVTELGYTCTDDLGYFELEVSDPALLKRYAKQPLNLTVTNDDKEVLHREKEPILLSSGRAEHRDIILDKDHCGTPPNETIPTDTSYLVQGVIKDVQGRPLTGLHVRAVDQDFTGENPLGEPTKTDAEGAYAIPYRKEDFVIEGKESGGADIILYVSDADGNLLHQSEPSRNSPRIHTIDLVIDTDSSKGK